MNLKMIDLFAGIGAFRLAFEKYNVECIFSADFDIAVAKAYEYAYGDDPYCDINTIDISTMPDFNILCAGFPCQPFSVAGLRLGFDDPRAQAAIKTFEIIKIKQPEIFILENVKGLNKKTPGTNQTPLKKILELLEPYGYHLEAHLYNAYFHGNTPQNRERYFITGIRKDVYSGSYTHLSTNDVSNLTFKNILEDPKNISAVHYYDISTRPNFNNDLWQELLSYQATEDFSDYVYQIRRKYIRRHTVKGRCPTLTKNMGTGGHNVPIIYDQRISKWRRFTPKECMRLQSFPENFPIHPNISNSKLYCIAGNSIPVTLATRVAKASLDALSTQKEQNEH